MKSEIRFKDREHLAFYNMVLKQTRKDDPYHKAFFLCRGYQQRYPEQHPKNSLTLKRIVSAQIVSMTAGRPVERNGSPGWLSTSGMGGILTDTQRRMIFFDCEFAPYFMEGIRLRYPEYCRELESQPPKWER